MRTIIVSLGIAALLLAPAEAAAPRTPPTPPASTASTASTQVTLVVEAGSGRVIPLPAPVANVFVSDPKIAEVRPASPTSLFLFGVIAGHTSVAALDAAGKTIRLFEVTVRPSAYGAGEAAASIAQNVPGANVRLEAQPKRLVVRGRVATPAEAQAASTTATAYFAEGQTLDNQLRVNTPIQVGLRVRIAEMSRNVTRNLGINWQALGTIGSIGALPALSLNANSAAAISCLPWTTFPTGRCPQGVGIEGLINALAQDNLVHVLAEPNLVAMSGETASFLVGGEFPIPVAQGGASNAISVEFKQYGIALDFVPTVLSGDSIRVHVRPEVSQLTSVGSVTINGTNIPALTVRRADTTVELGSGQSFAIAGLLSDQTTQAGTGLPEIGDVPILGALFRSDAFQRQETELVIIVTPYLMRPVNDPTALRLPTDGFRPPNDLERLLLLRQTGIGSTDAGARVPGQAGFVVE